MTKRFCERVGRLGMVEVGRWGGGDGADGDGGGGYVGRWGGGGGGEVVKVGR